MTVLKELEKKMKLADEYWGVAAEQVTTHPSEAFESICAAREILSEAWTTLEANAEFSGLIVGRMMEIDNGLAALERVLRRGG